ncbi:hypothetical protein RND71_019668 [Anisodus tanguticus]|uniref:alpha-amylase n=1 Tax=Anisodus tanguticus TaxID=243964 RepID=A0AAE1VEJ5_9SOLA|nr:hypothetical protein RND71_019668 [Anisodus tanguticus]
MGSPTTPESVRTVEYIILKCLKEDMGTSTLPDALFGSVQYHSIISSRRQHDPIRFFTVKSHSTIYRRRSGGKRFDIYSSDDSTEALTDFLEDGDGNSLGRSKVVGIDGNELLASRKAHSDAQARNETIEKERDQLLEKLAPSEAKQEYLSTVMHDKDLAISELEAAKALFTQKLEESVEEKFNLESKLVLAKQDAVELAVQVEKLAEIAFQQATSHILEDAQLRVSAAETSAAEAAFQIEEQIRTGSEGAITYVLQQSKDAIEKALDVAESAGDHTTNAMAAFVDNMDQVHEIISVQSQNLKLSNTQARKEAKAYELRANDVEKLLLEFQESSRKSVLQQEEEIKSLLEKMRKDATEKKKAASKAFKLELERMKAAIEAAKETARSQDERSLRAAEAASKTWRQRAEMAEDLLLRKSSSEEVDEEAIYCVNGGRIDFRMDDDSQKWRLLTDGPPRPTPEWMARRIRSICPRFPPRKTHVPEKEVIEKKRKALERALQRKTVKWQRTPEETKLGAAIHKSFEYFNSKSYMEPRVFFAKKLVAFQGFNWESWRRQWYLELASKAADLSQCGITAVWLSLPTESVAPQGKLAWGPEEIVCDDPNFQGRRNPSSGMNSLHETYGIVLLISHTLLPDEKVYKNIKILESSYNVVCAILDNLEYMEINTVIGALSNLFSSLHHKLPISAFDISLIVYAIEQHAILVSHIFVQSLIKATTKAISANGLLGFSGGYIKEYIEASNPAFSIGEYWDSLAYEGGNLCYNQDAHRQRIVNWINATGGSSSAFDVTTKGILHSALHNQYWRLIDPRGKPTGVMGWWLSRAVTFLENHDTGSTQPVIFYDHFYDFGIRDVINELIEARRRAGIHCRSNLKIFHANSDGYVAQIGNTLVMKLGHLDGNPSKEVHLDGTWQKFVDKGPEYQIWLRQ